MRREGDEAMTGLVTMAASGLGERTSRRGFLARSGRLIMGLVGGSTLLTLMAQPASAQCRCANACPAWWTCGCGLRGNRLQIHWWCPSCSNFRCEYYQCSTNLCR